MLQLQPRSIPILVLGVILVLLAFNHVQPGLLNSFGGLAKTTVGALAAVAGVYIIYDAMQSRSKADDFVATFFALLLFSFAAYFGFGINLASVMSQLATLFEGVVPFLIAAGIALTGLALVQVRRDRVSQAIGIGLMIMAFLLMVKAV